MNDKRSELIRRNEEFIQIPKPNLSKMTNEQLEKRAETLEKTFQTLFNENHR